MTGLAHSAVVLMWTVLHLLTFKHCLGFLLHSVGVVCCCCWNKILAECSGVGNLLSLQLEGASWWGVMRQNLEEAGHAASLLKEQKRTAAAAWPQDSGLWDGRPETLSTQPEALTQALP